MPLPLLDLRTRGGGEGGVDEKRRAKTIRRADVRPPPAAHGDAAVDRRTTAPATAILPRFSAPTTAVWIARNAANAGPTTSCFAKKKRASGTRQPAQPTPQGRGAEEVSPLPFPPTCSLHRSCGKKGKGERGRGGGGGAFPKLPATLHPSLFMCTVTHSLPNLAEK